MRTTLVIFGQIIKSLDRQAFFRNKKVFGSRTAKDSNEMYVLHFLGSGLSKLLYGYCLWYV